jgi:hypothetical protein
MGRNMSFPRDALHGGLVIKWSRSCDEDVLVNFYRASACMSEGSSRIIVFYLLPYAAVRRRDSRISLAALGHIMTVGGNIQAETVR